MKGTVIQVIDTLGRGGAEAALVSGLPALQRLGWRVHVVALALPYDLAPDLRERGLAVDFGRVGLLRALLLARRPRLIHTHLFFANMWGRAAAALAGVPLLSTLHNPDYGIEGGGRFGGRIRLDRGLLALLRRPTFAAVSEIVRDDYRTSLGISSHLVANPVDPFWLAPPPSRAEARARLGIAPDDDRAIVFACGRLHVQKGFDVLAQVARALPRVRFVVAGGGPEEEALRAEGGVELVGRMRREGIRDWTCAADLVAAPSRWESFGIFVLEAMAVGAAIIASDIPGLRDTVGDAARLIPPGDAGALRSAIEGLLADPAERARLGDVARKRAPQFSPEAWAARYDEIYSQMLGSTAPTA